MCYSIYVHPDLKNTLESSTLGACSRSKCCSFKEGGLRELVQLVIRGECLTGDDSIAYDRSFA